MKPCARPLAVLLASCFVIGTGGCDEPARSPDKAAQVPAPPYRFERIWERARLQHQPEATGVSTRDGWLYVGGGGGPASRISKVRISDGKVAWSVPGGSYQPSYPVSDGRVVVLGAYYELGYRALDDGTGAARWTPVGVKGAMGSACFADGMAFVGSYHSSFHGLYALEAATGAVRWKAPVGGKIWSTPLADGDLVLVACYDAFIYAFNRATGRRAWRVDCGGRIKSNPVLCRGLAFLGVDDQSVDEPYDTTKVQKHLVVVDLATRTLLARFEAKGQWNHQVIADGDQVFFSDDTTLHVFDCTKRGLAFTIPHPPGVFPYPFLTKDRILLGIASMPLDCLPLPEPRSPDPVPITIYDRKTGKKIASTQSGGIRLRGGGRVKFVQVGEYVLTLNPVTAYRLRTE